MDEHRPDDGRGGTGGLSPSDPSPYAFVSPSMMEADEAFRRDLPQLLKERPGEWVGYHGSERIGFAATKDQMYRECLERGLRRGEFFVTCVEPEEDLIFGPGAIWDVFHGPSLNPPDAFVSPLILEANEIYRRELGQLLEERPGQWVGYHGSRRIGFAATKDQMYRECRERGLKDGEFFVGCIEPEADIIFGPGAIWDLFGGRE